MSKFIAVDSTEHGSQNVVILRVSDIIRVTSMGPARCCIELVNGPNVVAEQTVREVAKRINGADKEVVKKEPFKVNVRVDGVKNVIYQERNLNCEKSVTAFIYDLKTLSLDGMAVVVRP